MEDSSSRMSGLTKLNLKGILFSLEECFIIVPLSFLMLIPQAQNRFYPTSPM